MSFDQILKKIAGERLSGGNKGASGLDTVLALRLVAACLLFAASLLLRSLTEPWPMVLLIVSALAAGYDIIAGALLALLERRWLDKCVVVLVAVVIAFAIGQSTDGAAIALMFQMGWMLLGYVGERTDESLESESAVPEAGAITITRDGESITAVPGDMEIGDSMLVSPGDIIPCDGLVLSGAGSLDASPVGGGAEPVFVSEGDEVMSGCRVLSGSLTCEVTNTAAESAAAVFAQTVSQACAGDGGRLSARFESVVRLAPAVIAALGVLVAVLTPIITNYTLLEGVRRAVAFFVLANSFSLVAAVPFVRKAAVRGAAVSGAVFADRGVLERVSRADAVAFDCTGTLTDGQPRVSSVKSERLSTDTLLKITAHAMAYSSNKFARSIISAYGGTIYIELLSDFREYPEGVEVYVDNVRICAGSIEFLKSKDVEIPPTDICEGMAVYISVADTYAGRIVLTDGLRADAAAGVSDIAARGVGAVVMLTDEPASVAAKLAGDLGIREYYSGCVGDKKTASLADVKRSLSADATLVCVSAPGDLNAASPADVKAVMGGADTLASARGADLTILSGHVTAVAEAIGFAKSADRLCTLAMYGALLVKLVVIILAVFGFCAGWFSAFMDAAASVAAVLLSIKGFEGRA